MKWIALIAGKGDLPKQIIECLNYKNIKPFVVAIKGFASEELVQNIDHIWSSMWQVGDIIHEIKKRNIKEVIFAGSVIRPDFSSLKLDKLSLKLLSQITKAKFLGDDSILKTLTNFLEEYDLTVISVQDILENILTERGILGSVNPYIDVNDDINLAKSVLSTLSLFDIGQAIIVENRRVLGIEGPEGTDLLIERCKKLKILNQSSGILVKMAKCGQDQRIDLPTIGVDTIHNLMYSNFSGIALEAGKTLIINKPQVINIANELGIFIIGI